MNDSVLLLSGGLDSCVLLAVERELDRNPWCLFLDYGQRHRDRERDAAFRVTNHYNARIHCSVLPPDLFQGSALTGGGEVPQANYDDPVQLATIVPNRNMAFLSLAGAMAVSVGAKRVLFAAHAGDAIIYPDCRSQFVHELSDAMDSACKVKVVAPFLLLNKKEVVQLGRKLGAPLELTWSCYVGGEEPCGECGACRARLIAEVQP